VSGSVSEIIAAVSLVVAIVLGIKHYRLGQRNKVLQERLLALEETREQDRVRENTEASLVADIQRGGRSGTTWLLSIENKGRSEARDITVLLGGQPILEHPGVAPATKQGLNKEVRRLPGGSRFRYVLAPTLRCRPPWELEITWADDSGRPRSYCTTLTF
jgi:hypothetical protein